MIGVSISGFVQGVKVAEGTFLLSVVGSDPHVTFAITTNRANFDTQRMMHSFSAMLKIPILVGGARRGVLNLPLLSSVCRKGAAPGMGAVVRRRLCDVPV